jgi:hypothetical protein
MTMQQVTMSEYLKTRYGSFPHCGSCVCQKCLYWWSGRCPEGECYDDKRAKEEPYNKAFPERSPRTQWSNWNLPGEQAHWCRGGTFFIIQYHGETRDGDSRGQLLTEPIKTIDTAMEVLDMIATQSALCNAGIAVYLVDEIEKAWYMDMPEE